MARKIVHQLIDDIDGTILELGDGETVHFALDGTGYEIDLTDENAAALRDAFAPFVQAGRRVSAGGQGRAGRSRSRAGQRDLAPVRAWAKENGYSVSTRGRVPAAVLEAYDAAH